MIKKSDDMVKTIKPQMRGGTGEALVTEVLSTGEYTGKARLIATIALEPGCSIGEHVHEKEEEVFYIIDGTAAYNDNGKSTTLQKGDSCICCAGQKHSIANAAEKGTLIIAAIIMTL
jgi:quercetin dioxygenase-like cupin family protein